ncbi:LysR family transcriptional regulator [Bosea caraganae]|uniref:LysR family transcriptional regulator n=1 Tax=Bosea caraganae TaxID=2763117 RepID=A0A370L0L1_9HYPH|nr:LysR substrate-binding domain-containing protein [Bosea caraganae]RDJ20636.1 LysR family transcriptional regulator [Bosea caraganae]RDJ28913.1 LysR family transcriptional regulator [Bosea caraganae]
MDTRALRCFLAVAEELHFGRAAVRLNMSQPPVTQQIKKLEEQLQTRLFDRNKRFVRLTLAGVALVEEATRLLAQMDELAIVVKRAERGEGGRLRIGFATTALLAGAGELYQSIRKTLPCINETWVELYSAEQVDALERDQIDIGFARTPLEHHGLSSHVIATHSLLLALPASHEAAECETVALSSMSAETFVLSSRGPGFHDSVISICQSAGFNPKINFRAQHLFAILNLVSVGVGIALVPEYMAKLNIPGIRLKRMSDVSAVTHLSVMWNPANRSPIVAQVVRQMQEVAPSRPEA